MVKAASATPLCANTLAVLAEQAGVPAGVLNLVSGDTQAISNTLMASTVVRKLSFTGSTKVGKLLMSKAADTVKKLSLELGGNAPFIVFDDADLDAAVAGAMAAKFRNTGQTCVCVNRFLVQAGIYDSFVAKLAKAASAELKALAMPDAKLLIEITATERTLHGQDDVAFLLAPHAGALPRPLGKGASGGELSRVMLALEVVLAAVDPVPTFVFDEVDSGVGGKAAVEIGRRLAMLAEHVQVLVVTHLPQVAAFADQHILVTKNSVSKNSTGITTSNVRLLTHEERVVELARMLAGQEDSVTAQAHAKELLAQAARPTQ